jgi:hypothetical protein
VLEGGFHPDDITPRPPFIVVERAGKHYLQFDPTVANGGERSILGGLKTKNVDVVVTKDGIGPVLAISCKGMTVAFRNLTNRMEETIGECTNIHITYPALVFGYMFVIRANERLVGSASSIARGDLESIRQLAENDIALKQTGEPVETIFRFHSALRELTGRRGIRDEVSSYEAVTLAMIKASGERTGEVLDTFPLAESRLRFEDFFQTLYQRYEERFVFGAPDLKRVTRRLEWAPESAIFAKQINVLDTTPYLDFAPRFADITISGGQPNSNLQSRRPVVVT